MRTMTRMSLAQILVPGCHLCPPNLQHYCTISLAISKAGVPFHTSTALRAPSSNINSGTPRLPFALLHLVVLGALVSSHSHCYRYTARTLISPRTPSLAIRCVPLLHSYTSVPTLLFPLGHRLCTRQRVCHHRSFRPFFSSLAFIRIHHTSYAFFFVSCGVPFRSLSFSWIAI
ncbi:hypothetical protein BC835DRAFT_660118 [Cytidiella melzeri]|nr:hypothetical protein BC835DRAFT_660118 [Cytidiella melzeri]